MSKLLSLALAAAAGAAGGRLALPPLQEAPAPEACPCGGAAHPAPADRAAALSLRFQETARAAAGAVVEVSAYRGRGRGGVARGSGVVVDADGLLVTNRHVVDGAGRLRVRLADGRELDAAVLAADPFTDLAVLSVEARGLPTLAFRREPVAVGEWVLALGNAKSMGASVTAGIVSAVGRSHLGVAAIEDFIQTDAAINDGNSGGPLVDLDGRVVGITTAKGTPFEGTVGIGFAIPAYLVEGVVESARTAGLVQRAWLGIRMVDLSEDEAREHGLERAAVLVTDVLDGPAREGGVLAGDAILAIDGVEVSRGLELLREVARMLPGRTVALDVRRGGEPLRVEIVLEEREPDMR